MKINGYTLKAELKNANSGFAKWGFAIKGGKEYFIKELITPVYPVDKNVMSEEMYEQKITFCSQYEKKFLEFYSKINKASRGNLVRINEFFRCGSHYYLITEKVEGELLNAKQISSLDDNKKLLLLKVVSHCFDDLHSAGIVHFDVKPSNVLVKMLKNGNCVAKLIDFDSGFIKGELLEKEEIGGDLTYLAPETFLRMYGEDVILDEKADIFALGLLFHEYYCGEFPYYDTTEYEYPYEVLLNSGELTINSDVLPDEIGQLIEAMLNRDPQKRPSAKDIIETLNELGHSDETANVKRVSIQFDGHYGKYISVSPDKIKYRNTIHPTIATETQNFPAFYSAEQEKTINIEQFNNIIAEVSEAGLFDIVTSHKHEEIYPGAVYKSLFVVLDNGVELEYYTCEKPVEQFNKVAEVLSAYCEFPEIEKTWYKGIGEEPEKKTEDTGEYKNGWFKIGGDL